MTEADVEAMQRHLHTALETLMEIAFLDDGTQPDWLCA